MAKKTASLNVGTHTHDEHTRINLPSPEHQPLLPKDIEQPRFVKYPRNADLDPQLVWRGKDLQDWSDLVVTAPPLYIQERVHPKALIDDLKRMSKQATTEPQLNLFADFNGLPENAEKTEFYQHQGHWTNRMILGDSLQVMASLAEREQLRGQVQCIYFDPPYGIKFNSNFQWSTTTRDVKDGKADHITREPEMVKAFRDTWKDGIHSYLSYLRDRLTVARDLLTDSGSIFVQIGDENVHRVRALMDEVFGEDNIISLIAVSKTGSQSSSFIGNICDYIIWYGKDRERTKYRQLFTSREERDEDDFSPDPLLSSGNSGGVAQVVDFEGQQFSSGLNNHWKTNEKGMITLVKADRIVKLDRSIRFKRYYQDYPVKQLNNLWNDLGGATSMVYVVQTATKVIERCLLMTTDPGDLVLDPTCGSGTTAYVAEQWGRRWITIDTSRVAMALARARIMGARYPWYLLADSKEGQQKEAELTRRVASSAPTFNRLRQGFVYERVPHITLKSIANNTEIDTIYEQWQRKLEPLLQEMNQLLGTDWQEWQVPRQAQTHWPDAVQQLHAQWWQARIGRQKEIDASIAARAEYEYLYDRPYEDKKRVRVAGPFTVESLSPHRILGVDENGDFVEEPAMLNEPGTAYTHKKSFAEIILENIKAAGVQQAHKEHRISFSSLEPWPGHHICAEGRYNEGDVERRAGILIGPEYGNLYRQDIIDAARECADAGFDVLITFAFNYDAHVTELEKLGRLTILKARMNADLHMAQDLKNTGKGNLFVIFGEPDIEVKPLDNGQYCVQVHGVDTFDPSTGKVASVGTDGIACWFIDTDYNSEAFFVRHAYFLGANDPYNSLKNSLKAEIDAEAWATLKSDKSRPFDKPSTGRIAVKVINHLGDEVLKVVRV